MTINMLQLHQHFMKFSTKNFPKIFRGIIPEKAPLFFRKFPEKFRRKFQEISELTTLATSVFKTAVFYANTVITLSGKTRETTSHNDVRVLRRRPLPTRPSKEPNL